MGQRNGIQVAATLPEDVLEALKQAAAANYESIPGYIRRVLIERLRAEGFLTKKASV